MMVIHVQCCRSSRKSTTITILNLNSQLQLFYLKTLPQLEQFSHTQKFYRHLTIGALISGKHPNKCLENLREMLSPKHLIWIKESLYNVVL